MMAPMAYTYLTYLTYEYYLSDSEEEKAQFHIQMDEFRYNDYETSNGKSFENNGQTINVDEGIAFMDVRPTEDISKEQHYFRNKLNLQYEWEDFVKLNEALPDYLQWYELPFYKSIFHKFSFNESWQGNNRKYVSKCEHFEIVFTKENYLVDADFNSTYMGTYNYFGPSYDEHFPTDVDPYYLWGNVD